MTASEREGKERDSEAAMEAISAFCVLLDFERTNLIYRVLRRGREGVALQKCTTRQEEH